MASAPAWRARGHLFKTLGARERICPCQLRRRMGRERAPDAVRHPPAPKFHRHMIQSVLFQSPYSGCPSFSGWPKEPCQKPVPEGGDCRKIISTRASAPLCVDKYRPGWRELNPIKVATAGLQPIQYRTCPVIRRISFKVCQDPSANGPWTIRHPDGLSFSVSNSAAGRLG